MPSKIITESQKQEIKEYYMTKPMSLSQVAKHFNLCNPTIGKILSDVSKYTKSKIFNNEMREDYFECIDCENKAYFLGLILSDGNVFHPADGNRQDSVSITLNLADKYMLNNFKEEIRVNTSIVKDGRGCGTIAVRSNQLASDLRQYGVVPRKSFKTYLPTLDSKYMPHLIRGILDGDGCIQYKPIAGNRHLHSFSFCGTHQLMCDIRDYISFALQIDQIPAVYDYKSKELSELKIQNSHDAYVFGEWIYKDATLFLYRKKSIYDNFKRQYQYGDTEVNNQIAKG